MESLESSDSCTTCGAAVFEDMNFCPACGSAQQVDVSRSHAIVVKEFAAGALTNADEIARELLSNTTVKKIAGGAVLGMAIAAVVPFITFSVGATFGAAYVGYKTLTKD